MQESRQDKLELKVKDNGLKEVGLKERNHDSFGSKLIGMMVSQLEGTAKYEYSDGLEFTVSFHK
jgi:two-component sensor histidine kinase